MSTLSSEWEPFTSAGLSPIQVDRDVLRQGLDPTEVRELISVVTQQFGVAFGTGVLAGIRLGPVCRS